MVKIKKLISILTALSIVFAYASIPGTAAEPSVYDFDYGSGISWPEGEQLPSFSEPAEVMDAVLLTGSNDTPAVKYLMASVQGIVNREQPRVVLINNNDSRRWINDLFGKQRYVETSNYMRIVKKYASCFEGIVLYNENVPATLNVATSIAGAENCIIANSQNVDALKRTIGVDEVKVDLSRIENKRSAYNYLYNNYYAKGKLNKRLLVGLNPSEHTPVLRDLAIALKSAVLWLDPKKDAEVKILDKFYDKATPGVTYHMGWWTEEDPGVTYGTKKGVATIPSDWFTNMTVYMGQSKDIDIPKTPDKPKLENKVYIAFALSDGDNLQYVQNHMRNMWDQARKRADVPISWTCTAALYYAAPQMLNYYYKTAVNDMLISGPSGFGYTKTTRWRYNKDFLDAYVKATDSAFEKAGFNIITMWDRISEQTYAAFSSKAKSILGVTINNNGFNDADSSYEDTMFDGRYKYYPASNEYDYKNNIPIIGLHRGYCSAGEFDRAKKDLTNFIKSYDQSKPEFRFFQTVAWDISPSQLYAYADELNESYGDKIEFVRADHLFMLMNEYNNKPYNLSLESAASASFSDKGLSAKNTADGSATTAWSASNQGEKYITLDLGKSCSVARYTLKSKITSFDLMYSTDGKLWKIADAVSDNTENVLYAKLPAKITARYIRLNIKGGGAQVQELEIWGNPVSVSEQKLSDAVSQAPKTQGSISGEAWKELQTALSAAEKALEAKNPYSYPEIYGALSKALENIKPENDIPAVSIALPGQITLNDGAEIKINASLSPANSTDSITEWKSSDENVAYVNNGTLIALNPGHALITAKTQRGVTAQTTVIVKTPVSSVRISRSSAVINKGTALKLTAYVLPINAYNQNIKFISSAPSVASVSQAGVVTGLKAGTAVITAASEEAPNIKASCTVTVRESYSLKYSRRKLILRKGKSRTVKAAASPKGSKITYRSGSKQTARVNKYGKITAVNGGKTYITASANGKKARLRVYVNGFSKGRKYYWKNGKKLRKRFVTEKKKRYYLNSKGRVVKNKTMKIKGKKYRFNKYGAAVRIKSKR